MKLQWRRIQSWYIFKFSLRIPGIYYPFIVFLISGWFIQIRLQIIIFLIIESKSEYFYMKYEYSETPILCVRNFRLFSSIFGVPKIHFFQYPRQFDYLRFLSNTLIMFLCCSVRKLKNEVSLYIYKNLNIYLYSYQTISIRLC